MEPLSSGPPDDVSEPEWVSRHGLVPGGLYVTVDSDLTVEYLGVAQVRDPFGFQLVMVLREIGREGPLLTLGQSDAEGSAGFLPYADHVIRGASKRREGDDGR